MKFLDQAKVYIRSGDGGAGAVSFLREKFVEFGGPSGGDGGKGGDVWVEAVDGLNTLIDYRYQQHFFARNGQPGSGQQRTGRSADDVVLKVPAGTEILEEELVTPLDWQSMGMAAGTPFALAHTFPQTGPFRPSNVDRRVPGLVFAGSGTVPGVGVPMVLPSGRLAALRVQEMVG